MSPRLIAALMIVLLAGAASLATPAAGDKGTDANPANPELGVAWRWEIEPMDLPDDWQTKGFIRPFTYGGLTLSQTPDGEVFAILSQSVGVRAKGSEQPRFRLVLMDEDGNELKSAGYGKAANDAIIITRLRYKGEASSVARMGLAVLDLEGRREASAHALREATEKGASTLPLPVVGEPLPFDLPTMAGERIRAQDLKGKVVLIDCWATWCGPCMEKMPELRKAYDRHKGDGLVVIGVNFDEDRAKARRVIAEQGLDWPHVNADDTSRGIDDLWERSAGITHLPRLFLIGRDGVLIDDFYPHDVGKRLAEALEERPAGG